MANYFFVWQMIQGNIVSNNVCKLTRTDGKLNEKDWGVKKIIPKSFTKCSFYIKEPGFAACLTSELDLKRLTAWLATAKAKIGSFRMRLSLRSLRLSPQSLLCWPREVINYAHPFFKLLLQR